MFLIFPLPELWRTLLTSIIGLLTPVVYVLVTRLRPPAGSPERSQPIKSEFSGNEIGDGDDVPDHPQLHHDGLPHGWEA